MARKDSGNEGCLNNPFFLATKSDGEYIYIRVMTVSEIEQLFLTACKAAREKAKRRVYTRVSHG